MAAERAKIDEVKINAKHRHFRQDGYPNFERQNQMVHAERAIDSSDLECQSGATRHVLSQSLMYWTRNCNAAHGAQSDLQMLSQLKAAVFSPLNLSVPQTIPSID